MDFNFNLNDNSLFAGSTTVFNNGEVGKASNVTMTLEKKAADDMSRFPDFSFVFTDKDGGTVNLGYYRFEPNPDSTEETNNYTMRNRFQTLISIARCFIPADFQFPATDGMTTPQVENMIVQTIENNLSADKKVNIFVTYGTKKKPSGFLRVRGFNFIEPAFVKEEVSKLKYDARYDNMERVVADAPKPNDNGFGGSTPAPNQPSSNAFWS